jgi:hypothetical protein
MTLLIIDTDQFLVVYSYKQQLLVLMSLVLAFERLRAHTQYRRFGIL